MTAKKYLQIFRARKEKREGSKWPNLNAGCYTNPIKYGRKYSGTYKPGPPRTPKGQPPK